MARNFWPKSKEGSIWLPLTWLSLQLWNKLDTYSNRWQFSYSLITSVWFLFSYMSLKTNITLQSCFRDSLTRAILGRALSIRLAMVAIVNSTHINLSAEIQWNVIVFTDIFRISSRLLDFALRPRYEGQCYSHTCLMRCVCVVCDVHKIALHSGDKNNGPICTRDG